MTSISHLYVIDKRMNGKCLYMITQWKHDLYIIHIIQSEIINHTTYREIITFNKRVMKFDITEITRGNDGYNEFNYSVIKHCLEKLTCREQADQHVTRSGEQPVSEGRLDFSERASTTWAWDKRPV
jgi:hypothetical protein